MKKTRTTRVLLIPRGAVKAGELIFEVTGAALRHMAKKTKMLPVKLAGRSVGTIAKLRVTRRGLIGDITLDSAAVPGNAFGRFVTPKAAMAGRRVK